MKVEEEDQTQKFDPPSLVQQEDLQAVQQVPKGRRQQAGSFGVDGVSVTVVRVVMVVVTVGVWVALPVGPLRPAVRVPLERRRRVFRYSRQRVFPQTPLQPHRPPGQLRP